MPNWLHRIKPKSAFARGVSVLVGGTAGAQVLMVLAAPLLTRLYSPEDFGILAAFAAILALSTVAAAARYELAIPIPDKDSDAANLTLLCVLISLFFSIITGAAFVVFDKPISNTLNVPQLESYLWILPIATLAGIFYEIYSKLALRQKNYKLIAKSRITQAIGTVSLQILGSPLGAIALVGGQSVGQGLGSFRLILSAIRNFSWSDCSLKGMKDQAYINRRYPQYSLWSALLNTLSLQLAPLLFIATYGSAVAGQYALTLRVLSMPGGLIGGAIGSVFLAEAPNAIRCGQLKPLLSKLHTYLAKLGALPLAIILLFGEDLFTLVFGESWGRAGLYAQMMAPWIYLQLQWAPLSTVGNLLELQKQILLIHTLNLTFRFSALAICALFSIPADYGVLIFSITSAAVYLFIIVWFFRKAGLMMKEVVTTDLKYISVAILACMPIYFYSNGFQFY